MPIIVLEGPDFAGKSTLSTNIRNMYINTGHTVREVHNGQPGMLHPLVDYVTQIGNAADDKETVTIFDRLHVGESIYGPIYRKKSLLSNHMMYAIEELLDFHGAVKIFVATDDSDLLNRFRGERGDDLVKDEDTLLRVARQYRDYAYRVDGWTNWNADHSILAFPAAAPVNLDFF